MTRTGPSLPPCSLACVLDGRLLTARRGTLASLPAMSYNATGIGRHRDRTRGGPSPHCPVRSQRVNIAKAAGVATSNTPPRAVGAVSMSTASHREAHTYVHEASSSWTPSSVTITPYHSVSATAHHDRRGRPGPVHPRSPCSRLETRHVSISTTHATSASSSSSPSHPLRPAFPRPQYPAQPLPSHDSDMTPRPLNRKQSSG